MKNKNKKQIEKCHFKYGIGCSLTMFGQGNKIMNGTIDTDCPGEDDCFLFQIYKNTLRGRIGRKKHE